MRVVTLSDIHCYLTLAGTWRAYVKREHPAHTVVANVWGFDKKDAMRKMALALSESFVPFDLSDNN